MGYGVLLYIWCLPSPTISFLYIGISIFHIFLVTSLPKPRFPNRIRRSPGHAVSSTGVPLTDQLVDALAGTNEGVTFPPWIERRDRREIYGRSMENLWEIYGKSMENLWKIYGKSIEYDEFLIFNQWPCNRNRLIGGTDSIYFWPIFQA